VPAVADGKIWAFEAERRINMLHLLDYGFHLQHSCFEDKTKPDKAKADIG
jgi:hypothetical protein